VVIESGAKRRGRWARVPRLSAACLLAAAPALLGGCAGRAGSGKVREVELYDLMSRKPDADTPDTPGALPSGPLKGRELDREVGRTVEKHRSAFQACIETASKGKGSARVRATLLLTVSADGAVTDARVAEKRVREQPLGQCLVDASRRMSFTPFEGPPLQVKIPLDLSAR
jgi:hypothetical protein